jgi:two-component system, chemotaxis family, CheB/CheR fusion protein
MWIAKKSKNYVRNLISKSPYSNFNNSDRALAKVKPIMSIDSDNQSNLELQQAADRLVFDRYAVVGVAIDSEMNIVQFRGQTGTYLEPATGTPSFNLFKMAKPELLVELQSAIYQSKQQHKIIRKEGVQVKTATGMKTIDLEVIPFEIGVENNPHFLVLFQEYTNDQMPFNLGSIRADNQTIVVGGAAPVKKRNEHLENTQLKQELAATREYLQAIIEEQESNNQAMQVANEEILSSNEELQSTNEELETSQEELHIINEEIHRQNIELGQINNDLQNLLSSINIPILMLDGNLRIRRFTALARPIFNLIPTDLGRPFSDIQPHINIPHLDESILAVIDTLTTTEQEIQDRAGHWYSLRIRPYRTIDNRIDGVVIGLIDINSLKSSGTLVEAARDYADAIVETVRHPLLVLDPDLRVIRANQSFYATFQNSPAQTEQQSIFAVGNRQWDLPILRSLLAALIHDNTEFQDFETIEILDPLSPRTFLLNARKIRADTHEQSILLAIEDITERRQAEAQSHNSLIEKEVLLREIHHRVKNNLQIVSSLLNLQSNRSTDAQVIAILQDSQNRVRAMALIHEILYQSPNLAVLDFDAYVQTLANNLFTSNNIDRSKIALSVDVQAGVTIDVDRAVLCGLIISELVTNALKHGFGGDLCGKVAISLTTIGNNSLILSVANNGKKLPKDFGIEQIRSMGLNLVMSLIKQIKGDLEVQTEATTAFKINFPLVIQT